jgi:hypothetical protein
MIKIGLSIMVAAMYLYASEVNVQKEHHESHAEMLEKQKQLHKKHERTSRPVEKAHALKVHKDYTEKTKAIHGESPVGHQD